MNFFKTLSDAIKKSDFWLHFFVCGVISLLLGTALAHFLVGSPFMAILGAFLPSVFCGLGKEYGDSQAAGNSWSWTDVFADVAGALIGSQIGWVALLI